MPNVIDLYCIPFAGGNAYSYRALEKSGNAMVNVVPLELPGRGKRMNEPLAGSIEQLARDVIDRISENQDRPFAFFGHSMGALVAYLAADILAREQKPLPLHLFLSGKGPPNLVSRESRWHTLPLPEFMDRLGALGGCPPAVIADRELMAYFAPIIRHDMRLVAEYEYVPAMPLDVPMTVMLGTGESTTRDDAQGWAEMTRHGLVIEMYEGGHFFIFDHVEQVCTSIAATLSGRVQDGRY